MELSLSGNIYSEHRKKKIKGKKNIFDRYTSAEDYAEGHREDHDGFEEALDAWYANQRKKKKK